MKSENIQNTRNKKILSMMLLVVCFFTIGCSKSKTSESIGTLHDDENKSVIVKEENPIHKYEYLAKLEDLDDSISESNILENEESTSEMIELEEKKFIKWDEMLSEICELLTNQFDKIELDKFNDNQLDWLDYRNNIAQEEADKFEGMNFAEVQYNSILTQLTKERCYEIVNTYLQ